MKRNLLSDLVGTLLVIALCCAVKYVAVPVYADIAGDATQSRVSLRSARLGD